MDCFAARSGIIILILKTNDLDISDLNLAATNETTMRFTTFFASLTFIAWMTAPATAVMLEDADDFDEFAEIELELENEATWN